MSVSPVTIATVESVPTAVVAEAATWESFPTLWPRLLDEVYAFVRACRELADGEGDGAVERWRNVMLYKDDTPSVEVGAALGRTHSIVRHFAAANELALTGVRWEVYGHWREDPRERETEVYYLLR